MAIKLFDKYGPRANPSDSNYPDGSIKNESVPGANDGTPLDKDWGNDMLGFGDALLAEAGITASGNPDTALASDRLDALNILTVNKISTISSAEFDTVDDMVNNIHNIPFADVTHVKTMGFNGVNDGGAATYAISVGGSYDGISAFNLDGVHVASYIPDDGIINFKCYGMIGDGVYDNADAFDVLSTKRGKFYAPSGVYGTSRSYNPSIHTHIVGALEDTYTTRGSNGVSAIKLLTAGIPLIKLDKDDHSVTLEYLSLIGTRSGDKAIECQNLVRQLNMSNVNISRFGTGLYLGDFWFSKFTSVTINGCDTGLHFASGGTLIEFDNIIIQGDTSGDTTVPIKFSTELNGAIPAPISMYREQTKFTNLVLQKITADALFTMENRASQVIIEGGHIEASTFNKFISIQFDNPYKMQLKLVDFIFNVDKVAGSSFIEWASNVPNGDFTIEYSAGGYDSFGFDFLWTFGGTFTPTTVTIDPGKGIYALNRICSDYNKRLFETFGITKDVTNPAINYDGWIIDQQNKCLLVDYQGSNVFTVPLSRIRNLAPNYRFGNGLLLKTSYYDVGNGYFENYALVVTDAGGYNVTHIYTTKDGTLTTSADNNVIASQTGNNLVITYGTTITIAGADKILVGY